jgi:hypothetical protein
VSPSAGDLWFDTTTGSSYIYYNSAWVELGGGSMSPYQATSTTRPSSPWTGQLVYETDTQLLIMYNGSSWVEINSALTKAPRGLVSFAQVIVASTINTTETVQITSPAFTAVANRYYRVTYYEPLAQIGATTPGYFQFQIRLTNITGTVLFTAEPEPMPNPSDGQIFNMQFVSTFTAGSTVLVATARVNSSTASLFGRSDVRRQLIIEDIGGV